MILKFDQYEVRKISAATRTIIIWIARIGLTVLVFYAADYLRPDLLSEKVVPGLDQNGYIDFATILLITIPIVCIWTGPIANLLSVCFCNVLGMGPGTTRAGVSKEAAESDHLAHLVKEGYLFRARLYAWKLKYSGNHSAAAMDAIIKSINLTSKEGKLKQSKFIVRPFGQ